MKNSKLKSKDFFDVEHNPLITFHSTKVEQTGPNTVAFDGDFTIRGVTKQERLTLTLPRVRTGVGTVKGTMDLRPQTIRDEQRHSVHQDC
jgi:polyisoprenoid-binding protein YceI